MTDSGHHQVIDLRSTGRVRGISSPTTAPGGLPNDWRSTTGTGSLPPAGYGASPMSGPQPESHYPPEPSPPAERMTRRARMERRARNAAAQVAGQLGGVLGGLGGGAGSGGDASSTASPSLGGSVPPVGSETGGGGTAAVPTTSTGPGGKRWRPSGLLRPVQSSTEQKPRPSQPADEPDPFPVPVGKGWRSRLPGRDHAPGPPEDDPFPPGLAPAGPVKDPVRDESVFPSASSASSPPEAVPAWPIGSSQPDSSPPVDRISETTGEADLDPFPVPEKHPRPPERLQEQSTFPISSERSTDHEKDSGPALQPGQGRAGRNLAAAIGVGVGLAVAAVASLAFRKEAFVALACAGVIYGIWELAHAFAVKQIAIPVIPLAVGSVGMLISAFVAGREGLVVAFSLTAFGCLLWRVIDGLDGAVRDVVAAVFAAAYVPLLAGFAMVMLSAPDGARRVGVFVLVTVSSDIGGYATGVFLGRHPLAPSVSPKKSWEGLTGSITISVLVGVSSVVLLLHGPWWVGAMVGAAAAVTATLGDLSESLIKRDLGVKDMGTLLPGHGGLMDRLDSLLLTAPVVYLLLTAFVAVP